MTGGFAFVVAGLVWRLLRQGEDMTDETTMFGIALTGHGGPECLVWRDDLPRPSPKAGEVLIAVAAAGVNNTDINTRVGWYSKGDNDVGDASRGVS